MLFFFFSILTYRTMNTLLFISGGLEFNPGETYYFLSVPETPEPSQCPARISFLISQPEALSRVNKPRTPLRDPNSSEELSFTDPINSDGSFLDSRPSLLTQDRAKPKRRANLSNEPNSDWFSETEPGSSSSTKLFSAWQLALTLGVMRLNQIHF